MTIHQEGTRIQRARHALMRLLAGRKRGAQKSLRTTVAILKAQQEATIDGILVVGNKGEILSYNGRFLEIWEIPPEVAATADDRELMLYAAKKVCDWDS